MYRTISSRWLSTCNSNLSRNVQSTARTQTCAFFSSNTTTNTTNNTTSISIKVDTPTKQKRRLDVAIVGAPNSGKSQFLNTVTNTIISAVSRKRHTTRNGILATHTRDNAQLVFIDTPGFVQCKSKKDEGMLSELVKGARAGMDRADYTLIVIDAAKRIEDQLREELAILMVAAHHSRGRVEEVMVDADGKLVEVVQNENVRTPVREKFAIVLNKVDLVNPKEKLLDIAEDIGMLGDSCVRYRGETLENENDLIAANNDDEHRIKFTKEEGAILEEQCPPVFFISALQNDGINGLLEHLYSHTTPTKEFVLPPDQKTAMSMAERVEEMIREKCYRCLHREVPHSITQVNRVLKKGRLKDGRIALRVDQDLIVKTKSHHKLVMGRGGMTLKRIEDTARRDLLKMFKPDGYDEVILNLHVKLDKTKGHNRELESDREGVTSMTF
jgi:GTP-binding protein Era